MNTNRVERPIEPAPVNPTRNVAATRKLQLEMLKKSLEIESAGVEETAASATHLGQNLDIRA